jgi:hypothetical protein
MKYDEPDLNLSRYHVPEVRSKYQPYTIDGAKGLVSDGLLDAIEKAALAYNCDIEDLTMADLWGYLVAYSEDVQPQKNRLRGLSLVETQQ